MENEENQHNPNDALTNLTTMLFRETQRVHTFLEKDAKWRHIRGLLWVFTIISAPFIYWGLGAASFASWSPSVVTGEYVAMVKVSGVIGPEEDASSLKVIKALNKAFRDEEAKGVVILINSPGGTPAQASDIHEHIVKLRDKFPEKKVIAVAEDYLTSGAYMVATGADYITVNRSTVTGSIGVIIDGWGLDKALQRFDVERRTLTAGEHKNRLSPYHPQSKEDVAKFRVMLDQMHQHFIDLVKETRAGKLKGEEEMLFSGDVWVGEEAVELGLVDEVASLSTVMETKFNVGRFKDYTSPPSIFGNLLSGIGTQMRDVFSEQTTHQFRAQY
jgi:protease-4